MATATITSKGQVTIPVEVRRALSVDAGDRLEFIDLEPGRVMIVAATRSLSDLKGRFRPRGKPVTIEAMNDAIARGADDDA